MNRLDTAQIEIPEVNTRVAAVLIRVTYAIAAGALLAFVIWGVSSRHNPVEQTFAGLSRIPLGLLVLDVWVAALAFLRRNASTPLRIPYKTPAILAAVHAAAALGAMHLAEFGSLYELVWVDDRLGVYEVQWFSSALLILITAVSVVLGVFELRLVRWVLISEITSAAPSASPADPKREETEDLELGTEHIYEAQVLLNNLGYEVRPISGELNEATGESIRQFQAAEKLDATGRLTAKTMIELRNRWREKEEGANPVRAVSEHAVRRTRSRIAGFFKRS